MWNLGKLMGVRSLPTCAAGARRAIGDDVVVGVRYFFLLYSVRLGLFLLVWILVTRCKRTPCTLCGGTSFRLPCLLYG